MIDITPTASIPPTGVETVDRFINSFVTIMFAFFAVVSVVSAIVSAVRDKVEAARDDAKRARDAIHDIVTGVEEADADLVTVLRCTVPSLTKEQGEALARAAHDFVCESVRTRTSANGSEPLVGPIVRLAKTALSSQSSERAS